MSAASDCRPCPDCAGCCVVDCDECGDEACTCSDEAGPLHPSLACITLTASVRRPPMQLMWAASGAIAKARALAREWGYTAGNVDGVWLEGLSGHLVLDAIDTEGEEVAA